MMRGKIPKFIQPFLWSYNIAELGFERDKKRIITNILNHGTERAVKWLFSVYKKEEIIEAVKNPLPGEWDKKSLNLWSILFDTVPKITKRQNPNAL